MRIKLSYKIFGAFLLTSFAIVSLTIGTLRFFGYRIFADYVSRVEMERLTDLIEKLTEEYRSSGNWERLQENPRIWRTMLRSVDRRNPARQPIPPRISNGFEQPHFGFAEREFPPPPQPPRMRHFRIGPRLFLLDAQRQRIAGRPMPLQNVTLREIKVDGNSAGWLGIHKREPIATPLEAAFLRQQNKLLMVIGGSVFLLAALVSFLLSRHLLAPIKRLTEGTRALASRRFGTRIEVRSGDELGQLASDFNAMAQTLEQYEQMRRQWISDISHELRTPLSILRGEIESMQDGVREISRQTLDSLHSEALHLGKIVNDLHELSMADSGSLRLVREPVEPLVVLQETLDVFKTRMKQSQIDLETDLLSDHQVISLGDAGRLAQLYGNILENTLRYTDTPGTLNIWHEISGKRLTLNFEDSGPGVPEESVSRLFDRLYRADAARNRDKGGSGLGLAICKAIVESHGGNISAANAPAGGLKIQVVLPLT